MKAVEGKISPKSMSDKELVRIVWPHKAAAFLSVILGSSIKALNHRLDRGSTAFSSYSAQRRELVAEAMLKELTGRRADIDSAWVEAENLLTRARQESDSERQSKASKFTNWNNPDPDGGCCA